MSAKMRHLIYVNQGVQTEVIGAVKYLNNAYLIAAAPALYEELKEADRVICELCYRLNPHHATADYGVGCKSCEDREHRLQALSKAEGEGK